MIVRVAITTCNRPRMVQRLVNQLFGDPCGFDLDVWVYDDGSDPPPEVDDRCTWYRYDQPHGREGYWDLVDDVFRDTRRHKWDRFCMLPDDVKLVPGFLEKCEAIWQSIPDERKICLNPMVDGRGHVLQWTTIEPEKLDGIDAWRVGWNDLCIWSERRLLTQLKYRVNQISPKIWEGIDGVLSSQVGKQISFRLDQKSWSMYQVDKTLVRHGLRHKSVMHPQRGYRI